MLSRRWLLVWVGACAWMPAAATCADEPVAPRAPYDTQELLVPLTDPEAEARAIQLPDGFRASLFAAEPMVRQPIGMTLDERGRLWVAENDSYAEREVNFAADQRDRIVIFEDTTGDGRADTRRVFMDGLYQLTSVEVGLGGVWAMCPPRLLFIPDANQDDVPDGEPVVLLDGFENNTIRHNLANGLKWGPDGWLYGRHGIQATSFVGPPGASRSQRTLVNCGIWRYHPTHKTFEMVCHGTTNPWGFDYDDHGEMFMINTVIGHLWHVVPGAHYRRMYGVDPQPYVYELLEQTADHFHWDTREDRTEVKKHMSESTSAAGGGHAHIGLMIYLGDNWPDAYRNELFTVNMHGRRINQEHLRRRGSGYVGQHRPDFAFWRDPWFRGIELTYGPDGGVFVIDWSDLGECHENDGVHRNSGRIYKIDYQPDSQPRANVGGDLQLAGEVELARLQLHRNDWYVRQARRLLQERALAGVDLSAARAELETTLTHHHDTTRKLRALWALYVIDAIDELALVRLLQHEDEHLRSWAVRLLVDRGAPSASAIEALKVQAKIETSGLVKLYLASAVQCLPVADGWELAGTLAASAELADDAWFPLMVWYGISPLVADDPARAVKLVEQTRLPPLRRLTTRRLTEQLETDPAPVDALVQLAGRSEPAAAADILAGLTTALEGWRQAPAPESWSSVAARLAQSENETVRGQTRELSVVFGDGRASDELRQIAADRNAAPESRRQALRILCESRPDGLPRLLKSLVADRAVAAEALAGLALYDEPDTPRLIFNSLNRLDPPARAAAINTLVARPAYAQALLDAVVDARIERAEVTAFHARSMLNLGDEHLTARLVEVWGEVRTTPAEKRQLQARYEQLLTPDRVASANLERGRALYERICANCHVLYGQGRTVGPDLTGSNRHNLAYLLENLLDPSATVAADFRVTVVSLTDGRVLSGVVTEQTPRTITLQTAEKPVTISRDEIDEQQATNLSLMPDGILNPLSDDEVRDLIGYLMR